uniref:Uncharacterized protein n=1 Tax=Oryza barthii TaxID=65489 RepID=A0A0D3H0X6_9ORYZ
MTHGKREALKEIRSACLHVPPYAIPDLSPLPSTSLFSRIPPGFPLLKNEAGADRRTHWLGFLLFLSTTSTPLSLRLCLPVASLRWRPRRRRVGGCLLELELKRPNILAPEDEEEMHIDSRLLERELCSFPALEAAEVREDGEKRRSSAMKHDSGGEGGRGRDATRSIRVAILFSLLPFSNTPFSSRPMVVVLVEKVVTAWRRRRSSV